MAIKIYAYRQLVGANKIVVKLYKNTSIHGDGRACLKRNSQFTIL